MPIMPSSLISSSPREGEALWCMRRETPSAAHIEVFATVSRVGATGPFALSSTFPLAPAASSYYLEERAMTDQIAL